MFKSRMFLIFFLKIFGIQSCGTNSVMTIRNVKRIYLFQNFLELLHFQSVVNSPDFVTGSAVV